MAASEMSGQFANVRTLSRGQFRTTFRMQLSLIYAKKYLSGCILVYRARILTKYLNT